MAKAAKRGRPTKRCVAVEKKIIAGLSKGTPLTVLCAPDDMPSDRTVRDWIESDRQFSADIARARETGFDVIAVEALQIIDAEPERVVTMTGDDRSESRIDSAAVQWAKNRAETRLKLLAKWDPKRYGELVKVGNPDGSNFEPLVDEATRAMRVAALLNRGGLSDDNSS